MWPSGGSARSPRPPSPSSLPCSRSPRRSPLAGHPWSAYSVQRPWEGESSWCRVISAVLVRGGEIESSGRVLFWRLRGTGGIRRPLGLLNGLQVIEQLFDGERGLASGLEVISLRAPELDAPHRHITCPVRRDWESPIDDLVDLVVRKLPAVPLRDLRQVGCPDLQNGPNDPVALRRLAVTTRAEALEQFCTRVLREVLRPRSWSDARQDEQEGDARS